MKGAKPMDVMPCTDYHNSDVNAAALAARARLKLLVLEADEETMDRIIEAIQFVCGSDSEIRQ
jgi:hypothetical protein